MMRFRTQPRHPTRVVRACPLYVSHSMMVRSLLPEAIVTPSVRVQSARMGCLWPFMTQRIGEGWSLPSGMSVSQTWMVKSSEPEQRVVPSPRTQRQLTGLICPVTIFSFVWSSQPISILYVRCRSIHIDGGPILDAGALREQSLSRCEVESNTVLCNVVITERRERRRALCFTLLMIKRRI